MPICRSVLMRFRILGPLEAHTPHGWTSIHAAQQRIVLAVLAAETGQLITVDRLVEEIWGERPPRTAVGVVRGYVLRLRKALGGGADNPILTRGAGYELAVADDDVDALVFRRLVVSGRQALEGKDLVAGVGRLSEALALWRGPALADVAMTRSVDAHARRLEQDRLAAMEDLIGGQIDLGRHDDVIGEAQRLVADHPLRERPWGQLMVALHRAGRRADALDTYQRARAVLREQLGLEPSAQLRELQLAILSGDAEMSDLTADAVAVSEANRSPVVATLAQPPHRPPRIDLPSDVANFVGRDGQLKQLDALLDDGNPAAPTVTSIVGTAGVGKTALAVHWAHLVAHRFPDGTLFVNLRGFDPTGPARTVADAVQALLDALEEPVQQAPTSLDSQLRRYRSALAGRRMLLVLDNARDAGQVRPLLPGSGGCFVVVTSRSSLTGLTVADGAQPVALDLMVPAEARALLAARLGETRVAAEPDAVTEIIDRCAGLPLALAVAAAHAANRPRFALSELAGELRAGYPALAAVSGEDTATDVRAVFTCSYRALNDELAGLFRLLGLHPGPHVTPAAAASLAGLSAAQVQPMMMMLAEANLLAEPEPGRYVLHDLLRQYALERAHAEDGAVRVQEAERRMLDHYAHSVRAASLLLDPHQQPYPLGPPTDRVIPETPRTYQEALDWFAVEHRVLLAAVAYTAHTGLDAYVLPLARFLVPFLQRRGHWHNLATTQTAALDAAGRLADRPSAAHAHRLLARAWTLQGRDDEALTHLHHAADLFTELGDDINLANTHQGLSWVAELQGRYDDAIKHDRQSLDLYQTASHRLGQARALNALGWHHALIGDHRKALTVCRQALAILEELDDRISQAFTWDSLGYAYRELGEHQDATRCYQRSLELARELGDRFNEAESLTHLGDCHHSAGRQRDAQACWQDALRILTELGHANAAEVRDRLLATA
jgi:DNA-binding SARP family transcriptional activator